MISNVPKYEELRELAVRAYFVAWKGAVAIRVGIEFGAISSVTRLPDYAARSRI
jgi:hypothetical protein